MKAKRSMLNLGFGLTSQVITIILGFFIPRLIMVNYGSEANGLIASIVQIISYFALLEAGVGAASLQALYKPVAKNDYNHINSILAATSSYYKKTGIYYFISVVLLAVIYPLVIHSEISKLSIMAIILFSGLGGAINYYYQGKFRVLLIAEGKSYIETSIVTIANILNNVVRIILLLQGVDIIAVQASFFALTVLQMIAFYIYSKRYYKWIDLGQKPDFEAIGQKNSVMVHEISYMIFRNTDVLILTIFTNLKVVSIYVMYNMIFTIVDNIVQTVNGSVKSALGQSYHEGKEAFVKFYDAYEVYFMGLIFSILTVVYILILPFMRLYTAGVNDVNYINFWLPVLFVVIKLLTNARTSSNNLITIAGHFRNTQFRSIMESAINLGASIICVLFFGIYGVLMGTIAALLYRSIDIVVYANRVLLERSPWVTFRRWLINVGVFVAIVFITTKIDLSMTSYTSLILWGVVLGLVILPIYYIAGSLMEREVFLYAWGYARRFRTKIKLKRSKVTASQT
ncbi:lipopolysaccharide biosynthesis protein [Paenibacillus sp. P32E]|uniref:lipopolysaccharide biosynthesis protein n=1 Tax=Paenibacillus sp. P32E TaxID=1349434 RepID=UPI00093C9437|nr:sugar isomerase [Paenibacillus sp. P32E]OKP82216.1 sugar isomerase [Paenibacillus sp. P32E]